jgi:hypothetical protein
MAESPLDDAKIDGIAREVLASLRKSRAEGVKPAPTEPAAEGPHPSLRLLSVVGGVLGQPCVIEPDKPCVGSLKCRSFGH